MSQIAKILEKLAGTREAEILQQMDESYRNISDKQEEWYKKSEFYCPDGCGECCRNFEPDLLECEALYMAAWLLENQPEVAEKVIRGEFPFPRTNACQFWNEHENYHCSIYEGRPFICRFFGACGFKGKDGKAVFKPCKFYGDEELNNFRIPLKHRQYSEEEIQNIFGVIPPLMSDFMETAININPNDKKSVIIRDSLPDAIRKLKWICSLK